MRRLSNYMIACGLKKCMAKRISLYAASDNGTG